MKNSKLSIVLQLLLVLVLTGCSTLPRQTIVVVANIPPAVQQAGPSTYTDEGIEVPFDPNAGGDVANIYQPEPPDGPVGNELIMDPSVCDFDNLMYTHISKNATGDTPVQWKHWTSLYEFIGCIAGGAMIKNKEEMAEGWYPYYWIVYRNGVTIMIDRKYWHQTHKLYSVPMHTRPDAGAIQPPIEVDTVYVTYIRNIGPNGPTVTGKWYKYDASCFEASMKHDLRIYRMMVPQSDDPWSLVAEYINQFEYDPAVLEYMIEQQYVNSRPSHMTEKQIRMKHKFYNVCPPTK